MADIGSAYLISAGTNATLSPAGVELEQTFVNDSDSPYLLSSYTENPDSGMDNAVRFDASEIVENGPGAYSLNQESVDLNAYLYAEKLFLSELATQLGLDDESQEFEHGAELLAENIRTQFFDPETGWF